MNFAARQSTLAACSSTFAEGAGRPAARRSTPLPAARHPRLHTMLPIRTSRPLISCHGRDSRRHGRRSLHERVARCSAAGRPSIEAGRQSVARHEPHATCSFAFPCGGLCRVVSCYTLTCRIYISPSVFVRSPGKAARVQSATKSFSHRWAQLQRGARARTGATRPSHLHMDPSLRSTCTSTATREQQNSQYGACLSCTLGEGCAARRYEPVRSGLTLARDVILYGTDTICIFSAVSSYSD